MSIRPRPLVVLARFFGVDSWRALAWVAAGWAIIVGLFLVQYSIYGYDRYLGWDTSTSVQLAHQMQIYGPLPILVQRGSPSLYYVLDWLIGTLAGSIGLGERVLPVVLGMALVCIYYRLGREVFENKASTYPGITAVLSALVPNTMRLVSDLHRNLFTLLAVLAAFIVLAELSDGRRSRRNGFIWLLVLSALAAYSEVETYALFLLAVIVYGLLSRSVRWLATSAASLPAVVMTPFMLAYFSFYLAILFTTSPLNPLLSFSDIVYFHGGLLPLVPLAFLGAVVLAQRARRPNPMPTLLLIWYLVLISTVALLAILPTQLPASRPLYLVPVPLLLSLSVRELATRAVRASSLIRTRVGGPDRLQPTPGRSMNTVITATIALLVISAAGIGLAAQKDVYMQPYIDQRQYADLVEIGNALQPYASSLPILVFYGLNGSLYYRMEQAYVDVLSGPTLGYYGRAQFLYSLTDPLVAEPGVSDNPYPSRYVAAQLYHGVLGAVGNASNVMSHVVVVSARGVYDRPVSDYVVATHRVSKGLYVIPPGSVTPEELDTWMWFAAYDWRKASVFYWAPHSWALSQRGLEYATPSLSEPWSVEYYMHLPRSVANATLSLHLEDTPPFPGQWNIGGATVGTFTVSFDNVTLARYSYANQGVQWVNYTLNNLQAGYHTVRIQADDLGKPFGLALDVLTFYPRALTLGTVLSAYVT